MFTPDTLAFLAENRFMNSREWFTAHEKEYTAFVKEPLYALSEALAPTMLQIDPQFLTKPQNAVSRIYCDLRFSRAMLYREMLWISYRRDRKCFPAWPEFYFVFSPNEFFYGCGYYSAKADTMDTIRSLILADHPRFRQARAAYEAQSVFTLDGELYRRSRWPGQPLEIRQWLDRRSLCFTCKPELEELFAPDLAQRMAAEFIKMKPVYDFLVYAEEAAAEEEVK